MVNLEELAGNFNLVVCFKASRGNHEWRLIAEVEIPKIAAYDFRRRFAYFSKFIICFGRQVGDGVAALPSLWYVEANFYTEYDGQSVINYLSGLYH